MAIAHQSIASFSGGSLGLSSPLKAPLFENGLAFRVYHILLISTTPSSRDLEEMMRERGLHVDYTTISRRVQHSAPELEKRCRPHLKATNDSWRVDETYIKVKKVWMYLSRAVDSQGNTLEFFLSPTRDAEAAKRFARQSAALHGSFSSSSASGPGAGGSAHDCG
jgi:hypothetical protein